MLYNTSGSIAGEILAQCLPLLERNLHPVVIISALNKALKESLEVLQSISVPIDTSSEKEMLSLIKTSIGTKFVIRWSDLMCKLALDAVRTVAKDDAGIKTVDIKRYARVEKVPGGEIEQSQTLDGIMVNKDVTHPAMRRRIVNPRIVLLDCPLEYKKGESQTNMEISKQEDWARAQEIEEEQVKSMCQRIMEFKPDLIFTEKGVSGEYPVAQGYRALHLTFGGLQILHNMSCCKQILLLSDGCENQTTTESHGQSVRLLSTALRICVTPTLEHSVACSTSKSWETSYVYGDTFKLFFLANTLLDTSPF